MIRALILSYYKISEQIFYEDRSIIEEEYYALLKDNKFDKFEEVPQEF